MGTSFEIFSYDNDKEVEAVLLTGKVKVAISDNKKVGRQNIYFSSK